MEPRPYCPPWRGDPRRTFSERGRPLEEDPRRELLETEMNLPVTFWMSRAGRDRVVEAAQQTSRRRVKIILELELLTLSWTILIMTNLFCWPLYIPTSLPLSSPSTRHLHHPIRGWLVRIRTFQSEEAALVFLSEILMLAFIFFFIVELSSIYSGQLTCHVF